MTGISFVTANFLIGILFFGLTRVSAAWPFHMLIYWVFYIAYVFKSVIQYAIGLNGFFSFITIRTWIDADGYVRSIWLVTLAHILLVSVLGLLGRCSVSGARVEQGKAHPSRKTMIVVLRVLMLWVVMSAVVMYQFGVALMGTDKISLPFRLSGVMFYSRTIVIPMMLMYFLQIALTYGDKGLARKCFYLATLLALTEVVVRASKSPIFILLLELVLMYGILTANRVTIRIQFKARYVIMLFLFALAIWPAVEAYRAMMVLGGGSLDLNADVASYVGSLDGNRFLLVVGSFFDRLLGFLQFAGLVVDGESRHNLNDVFQYDSIGRYYTQHYLGYETEGHLSSPSLLGASLILGGANYWGVVFVGYLMAMLMILRGAFLLPRFSVPLSSFIGVEIFNTIIAGTIDVSLERIAMAFVVALVLEFLVVLEVRRNRMRIGFRSV